MRYINFYTDLNIFQCSSGPDFAQINGHETRREAEGEAVALSSARCSPQHANHGGATLNAEDTGGGDAPPGGRDGKCPPNQAKPNRAS